MPLKEMSLIKKQIKEDIDKEFIEVPIWKEDQQLIQKKLKVFFDAVAAGPSTDKQKE